MLDDQEHNHVACALKNIADQLMANDAEIKRFREALSFIADIAEGSTTANSLPNIARIARKALRSNDKA